MNKTEQQREHFNSISEKYKKGREEENHKIIKNIIWERGVEPIMDYLPNNFSMLEAMCGFAEGHDIISNHIRTPKKYIGFDYSDEIVDSLLVSNPALNIVHADAVNYIPEEGSFDLIFLAGGLHHVPDNAAKVVNQLSKGLKPGGIFLNFEPTYANPIYKAIREGIYKKNEIFDAATERAFSFKELKSFFYNAGLNPISIQHAGLSAYTLYYNPYAFPILNKGNSSFVKFLSSIDQLFSGNKIGEVFSFATLSAWQKKS